MQRDIAGWVERILQGDVQAISRAISLFEDNDARGSGLLRKLLPHTGRTTIIGVTGTVGSGKSCLVDCLAALLRKRDKAVGILAVDPSSPFSGGALLGDRIRMRAQSNDPATYVRSMATRGSLGGVARTTLDAVMVLDAAGKEYILVETVGVGQDEVEIVKLADVTLVLLVPGLGDEVQAFKAGIMEIADIFVVNKADLSGAERVEQQIQSLLRSATSPKEWQPPIVKTVATESGGVEQLLEEIDRYLDFSRARGTWKRRQLSWSHNKQVAVEQNGEHVKGRFVLDHLGVAVESLAQAVDFYRQNLGLKVSGYETIPQEKTRVALLLLGETHLELLEPTEPDSPVGRFLAKRGAGLHHICVRVPDLLATVARLREQGVKLVNPEPAVGAGGHRYVFVHPQSTGGVLLELVEAP